MNEIQKNEIEKYIQVLEENPERDLPYFISAMHSPIWVYGPKRKVYGKQVEVRTNPKIGRNEPCPCGSGIKNKKCCKK